ncbi:replication endonuclease [Vibrio sp. Vb0599]|uniref:replication endonuclease n=1 Tax=Vibrio sp. Vb0599 TaxID=3074628 RepID=UPI002963D810|nr:replication endonuclease [Vibrio sp. Vb0599]MDW1940912.1 replication endonuclease [Vibrio sp. Vb0599]
MDVLTEPREIERYEQTPCVIAQSHYQPVKTLKFPWRTPRPALEEGLACIPRKNLRIDTAPEKMNFIEHELYNINPKDHAWRTEEKFFSDLPLYLTKYFAKRYKTIYTKSGRNAANVYLRTKAKPAAERTRLILGRYKKLPTTQKVALLSEEYESTDQSHFAVNKQMYFDFEQAEKQRKPVQLRLIAELEQDELKEMANKIANIVDSYIQLESTKYHSATELGTEMAIVFTYEQAARFVVTNFGMKPPRKYKDQSELSAIQDISKLTNDKWWLNRLKKVRKIMREHLAIAMGQVSNHASPYASWDCIREHKAQQKRNWDAIQNMLLRDEETEEEFELKDLVLRSVSNPAIRRHELMVRCRGCEDIGNELGLQGLFLTLTTPAKYHNSYKKGGFIKHWDGSSPGDAQQYLNKTWQRIRTNLGNKGLRWFGVRVAEPHHDGTPHWHLLIWVKPEEKKEIAEIFIDYATQEDKHELMINGEFDHTPRCDVGEIDPKKGTATGYIAKYISKNIDGYAMDDLVSDETGKPVKDMAKNVSAWKSRWNIRQFQFFGGAPVTTYRELRRFANNDKASFVEYLTQLNYQELLNIYENLEVRASRKFVGPAIPAELIQVTPKFDSKYLFLLLGEYYQPGLEHENSTVVDVMKAADKGNWHGYIMGQGGPFVKRNELLVTNVYEELPFASPHGETVKKLKGFDASGVYMKTRLKDYVITKKEKPELKKQVEVEFDKPTSDPSTWKFKKRTIAYIEVTKPEASAQGSEATAIGASGSSRSSVNNCTEPEKVQVSDQLTRLLNPKQIKAKDSPTMDDAALAALLKGSSIRIDNERSLQIRPTEVDERGNKRPAQLVEVSRVPADNLKWMDFEGWDKVFAQSEQAKDEYQQPDLSFFPDGDDWPLV